ncbi:MAG TPA: VapC toxin family PIN domain ribonuclease [Planktothrix sp. UBA8407]|jgi:Predicted nucleic acid-binding protein, contains PIN domain|nr:VapC toxin family PIN domain ribonuclease [Planktothrix sp. UBA8402]HAO10458.1 VapC toxin family PIN domain ribonuclease [Planktothrix sp. UBA8407]HBK24415.1 VapC toxin family PIN domain ribonuclease [Planktothrix sp. UBA10369]
MIVLDTNVVSEVMHSKGSLVVRQWVAAQPITNLFTTTITQAEILYGIALLPSGKRQTELSKSAELMFAEDFAGRILAFDETAAIAFARIATERRRMGKPISQADAQIASICYTHQATLATRNVSDFEGCGLTIINPWKSD